MRTIFLLFASNVFMTFAWYWHLNNKEMALWKVILISWAIAFFEYCLTIPCQPLGLQPWFQWVSIKNHTGSSHYCCFFLVCYFLP